jgi:membrane-associated phospholipid phosphatase
VGQLDCFHSFSLKNVRWPYSGDNAHTMNLPRLFDLIPSWSMVTHFGQFELVFPAVLLVAALIWVQSKERNFVLWWLVGVFLAVTLTLASKIAFIGWGIGVDAIDFTGISGHSLCAAAAYPVLMVVVLGGARPHRRLAMKILGWAVAILIGVSRLMIGAHSPSEVLAGLALGFLVSEIALAKAHNVKLDFQVPAVLALFVWFASGVNERPPLQLNTHSRITTFALALSGNKVPHIRHGVGESGPINSVL